MNQHSLAHPGNCRQLVQAKIQRARSNKGCKTLIQYLFQIPIHRQNYPLSTYVPYGTTNPCTKWYMDCE